MNYLKITIVLFLLFTDIISFGQWTIVPSGTKRELFSIHFPSQTTGYIVGRSSALLKTTDGGDTWDSLSTGLSWEIFESVYFINNNVGFITGVTNGKVLKTVDGGSNWTIKTLPTTNSLNDIKFVNDSIGFIAGYREIWKTTDQGNTWISQINNQSLAYPVFYSIEFLNKDTLFLAGVDGSTGRILKTTDGGSHWNSQSFGNYMRMDVKFVNDSVGYTTGSNPDIYKTTNGGTSWSIIATCAFDINRKLFFINDTTGYTVGYPNHILSTEDGGITWTENITNDTMDLQWVHFINENTGFAVGEGGRILKLSRGVSTSVFPMTWNSDIVEVFPNPASNSITINISDAKQEKIQLTLSDQYGKMILREELLNEQDDFHTLLSLSSLKPGVYFLSVQMNTKKITKKILVN